MEKPKVTKIKMLTLTTVFLWILICNLLTHIFHEQISFGGTHFINWSFFLSVTFYFLLHEVEPKKRILHVLCGGAVGVALGCMMVYGTTVLVKAGLHKNLAFGILITIALASLILLNPIAPMFFNNVGFGYLIVSTITSSETLHNAPSTLLWLVIGTVVLNVVCCVIVTKLPKLLMKKTAVAKQPETANAG